MKKTSFFSVMTIFVIVAVMISGASALALDQQGEQVQKGKQGASPTSPATGPAAPLPPLSSVTDDPEFVKKVEEFEKLITPYEQKCLERTKILADYAEKLKRDGGLESMSSQKLSEMRVELGKLAEAGRKDIAAFVACKSQFESILTMFERNLDKSQVLEERDRADAAKKLEATKKNELIYDEAVRNSLVKAQESLIDTYNANIVGIQGWHEVRKDTKKSVDQIFAVAGICVDILTQCENLLLRPSNVGAALARLEAHVAELQAFTLQMAGETKKLANAFNRKPQT